jgi:hypothetical protein
MMTEQDSVEERRKSPRYLLELSVEIRTPQRRVRQGKLVNVSEGGVMMETDGAASEDDLLTIGVRWGGGLEASEVVLRGKRVWVRPSPGGLIHHGVAFVGGDRETDEGLRRFREIVQARAVAETLGLLFVDLVPSMVESRALHYVNKSLAFSLDSVPIKTRGEKLMVAMANPDNLAAIKKLQLFSSCQIVPVVATLSAIRNTQDRCWKSEDGPPQTERAKPHSMGENRHKGKTRLITLISHTPTLDTKCLASNLTAVLNSDGKRAVTEDLGSGVPVSSNKREEAPVEGEKLAFVPLPRGTDPSYLDWVIRADESILVVSPSDWEEGCSYLKAAFDRF